ncbi:NPC intracellular cholesterol transporter 2-like [Atheta coriaria]|uniref:NPC intracellular cholesterol transporter 2-like n=1 Tax=Dalotia coriaria TaxID=877792 RepID=UPI0031F43FEB
MKQFFCVAAILVSLVSVARATEVNVCKSGLPLPYAVTVKDCDKGPCSFPRDSLVVWNITFDAPHDLDTFEPKVLATALGLDIDYPLNESEGCKELVDDECPLEEGQRVIYATTMEIKKSFPTINVGIEMTLYTPDEDGNSVGFTCFQIDCKVTE